MKFLTALLLISGVLKEGNLEIGGFKRHFLIYGPDTVKAVVIALHGGGGSSYTFLRLTKGRFNTLADTSGFLMIYPDAIGKHWNDGRGLKIYRSNRLQVDDVAFISALIDSFGRGLPVFITGMSNGGMMAFRIACELPKKISGIATVSASMTEMLKRKCTNPPDIPLLMINGTADPIVPFDGGYIRFGKLKLGRVIPVMDVISFWTGGNCPVEKEVIDSIDDGTRVVVLNYSCKNKVILYKIENGGHTFPGGNQNLPERIVGKTTKEINAADMIIQFFNSLLEKQ